jgi:hypothetical protein
MAKRGGRAYDSTGILGTSPGELAVLCPACPIPSVNLPSNWRSIGDGLEYATQLYFISSLLTVSIQVSILSGLRHRCLLSVQKEAGFQL